MSVRSSGPALSGRAAAAPSSRTSGRWAASLGQQSRQPSLPSVSGTSGAGTAPAIGSSSGRSIPAAAATELPGYLMIRAMDNRPIDSEELDALSRCDLTLNRTRRALSHGRGNVAEDLAATDWQNLSRVDTIDRYFERTILPETVSGATNLDEAELRARASLAITAAFLRAGNCGTHAELATHFHAASLRTGTERVYMQSVARSDRSTHEWAEMSGGSAGRVIMDPWSRGPAVLAEDCAFNQDFAAGSGGRSYSRDDATSIREAMRDRWTTLQTRDARTLWIGANQPVPQSRRDAIAPELPTRTSVIDPSFAGRIALQFRSDAGNADSSGAEATATRRELNQEILAAGVARSMGVRIDRSSARTVLPSIIESAQRLVSDGSGS